MVIKNLFKSFSKTYLQKPLFFAIRQKFSTMKAIGLLLGLIMISTIGGNPFLNNTLGEEAYAARSVEKQGKQN